MNKMNLELEVEITENIVALLRGYAGSVSLVGAIGILELVKLQIIEDADDE